MSIAASSPGSAAPAADERHMRRALEAARRALLAGEPPIGACLVRSGEPLATASNCVISSLDITAHAEMMVIREACRRERTLDLAGCDLYVTVEPCAMCRAAAGYAGIARIVHGATIDDLEAITGHEWRALAQPGGPLSLGGVLREEALALLGSWGRRRPS